MRRRRWDMDRDAIDALDAYWESLVAGNRDAPNTGPEPGLSTTVAYLYEHDTTPGVDPGFAHRLEARLMEPAQSQARTYRFSTLPARVWRIPQDVADVDRQSQRRPYGSAIATAALLVVTLAAGIAAIRWGGNGVDNRGASTIDSPAGSPTAAECDVPPRTAPPAPIQSTPIPAPITASRVLEDTRLWLEETDLPTGAPASAEELAGITATIRELVACEVRANADPRTSLETNWDSHNRQFALFTDDYLRRHHEPVTEPTPGPGTPTPPWWGDYWSTAAWIPGLQIPVVQQAIRMPEGRVGALLSMDEFGNRDFVVFVRVGDRWLIDEVAIVAPHVTTAGTPSAQERLFNGPALALVTLDIYYAPRFLTIPPDTDVTLVIANAGEARHTFNVDALDIHSIELEPGSFQMLTINAPAGIYDFSCTVPGHAEAGMTGQLIVDAAYQLPAVTRSGVGIGGPDGTPTPMT